VGVKRAGAGFTSANCRNQSKRFPSHAPIPDRDQQPAKTRVGAPQLRIVNASGPIVYIGMSFSRIADVVPFIAETAHAMKLVCFDAQSGEVIPAPLEATGPRRRTSPRGAAGKSANAQLAQLVAEQIGASLAPLGFAREGACFCLERGDLLQQVILRTPEPPRSVAYAFSVDLEIRSRSVDSALRADQMDGAPPSMKKMLAALPPTLQWIRCLTRTDEDRWWTVTSTVDARKAAREAFVLIEQQALPEFAKVCDLDALVAHWRESPGDYLCAKCIAAAEGRPLPTLEAFRAGSSP
jgi:hypothetical protein